MAPCLKVQNTGQKVFAARGCRYSSARTYSSQKITFCEYTFSGKNFEHIRVFVCTDRACKVSLMRNHPLAILFALTLSACNAPMDKLVPVDVAKWETTLKLSIDRLSAEDKKLFLGFMTRARLEETLGGKPIEEGMTIGRVIERQKTWVADEVKKEVDARLSKGKYEAERAALKRVVDDLLTVTVVELKLVKKGHVANQVIKLAFSNKGEKDILGIKGQIRFIDIFDHEVESIGLRYADGLKSGASSVWTGSRHYNQYQESHKALAALENGNYRFQFEPEMIVFADGVKLIAKR
jgi:hypothetical protein